MKRRLYLALCVIVCLVMMLSACQQEQRVITAGDDEASEIQTPSDTDDDIADTQNKEDNTDEENGEVEPGDVVFTGRESIVFVAAVDDPNGTIDMKVTMSQGFIRADIDELKAFGVINTNDDTGFACYDSKFGKASVNFYNLGTVEGIQELNLMCQNYDDLEKVERTTLDGRECIYAQMEDNGDVLELWYSEEYHILLKYVLNSSEGLHTMTVKSIADFDGDMTIFDMPDGYFSLGSHDAEGKTFIELAEEYE